MNFIFYFFAFIFSFNIANAQTRQKPDSLRRYYQNKKLKDTSHVYSPKNKEITKDKSELKDTLYAFVLDNLASSYRDMGYGYYEIAESFYLEAMKIREEVLGEKHPDYALSLNNLALLYQDMGNYAAAEPLFVKALKIRKEVLGEKHPDYATSLISLASLYEHMGNYSAAEPLISEAVKIRKESLGTKHPSYATSLNNLASLYYEVGNYEAAEPLFLETTNIIKEVLGEKHPNYAGSLNNLAVLYSAKGNYATAESLYVEALKKWKEILGEMHPNYAASLNSFARLYKVMGKYAAAESLFVEAIKIRKIVLDNNHPHYAHSLSSLANLYHITRNYNKAEPLFLEMLDITNKNIVTNFSFLSESEKEKYFKTEADKFDGFYSFALKRKTDNPYITQTVFNNVVRNKGLLLKSSTAMRTAIYNSKDTALINTYNRWTSLNKEITKLYSTEISKRKKNPEDLEKQANALEKELVKKSQAFSDFGQMLQLNWESVKNNLKPGEAAIEFVRFKNNISTAKRNKKADTITYCALIITPKSPYPEMLPLFEEKELEKILGISNDNSVEYIEKIYGTNENTQQQLYNLIWKPLEQYLQSVKTVYYSPDGLLHKVAFSAIGKDKNLYLCDQYNLVPLSNTTKVVNTEASVFKGDFKVCLYGGIVYSNDTTKNVVWDYLPGTKTEIERIESLLRSNKIKTSSYLGINANEKDFKENTGCGNILHIATHGFFFGEPEDVKEGETKSEANEQMLVSRETGSGFGLWQFVRNKNPLMRSGLAFAGANNVWNQRFAPIGSEDGVLTALEVSQTNLANTQLVILSACETGLGDIRGSEGVYGLQRAFKMAGVRYIMMSLWQIPDIETVEFMETFYKKLLKSKDVRKSFNETQKETRQKYDPYYWAAFVLIE